MLYRTASPEEFSTVASVRFWAFAVTLLAGAIAGSVYNIAIPTLIPVLVPEDRRDRANGMFGTTMGIAFAITSVFSGLGLAYGGMGFVLTAAPISLVVCIVLLALTPIPEPDKAKVEPRHRRDRSGAHLCRTGRGPPWNDRSRQSVPGLFGLIIFATINNFLGGVFFALMDAYGLTLVTVQVWGALWGFLSISFILGGLYIARNGLGSNPLRILFRNNIISLDDLHLVHGPALHRPAGGGHLHLDVPHAVHRGHRADHLPEGRSARAARPRVRLRTFRRTVRLAHHGVPHRPDRAMDLHPVHGRRRGRGPDRQLVRHGARTEAWRWCSSLPAASG